MVIQTSNIGSTRESKQRHTAEIIEVKLVKKENNKQQQHHAASASEQKKMRKSRHNRIPLETIIYDLNMSLTPEDRVAAISTACKEFHHRDKKRHNDEINAGAADALYQKLCLAISLPNAEKEVVDAEIAMICVALEMIHKCSSRTLERTFDMVGKMTLPLLISVLGRFHDTNTNAMSSTSTSSTTANVVIQAIMKILRYFSRVESAAVFLVDNDNLITSMFDFLNNNNDNRSNHDHHQHHQMIDDSTKGIIISTLADLAFTERNGKKMVENPEMIHSLLPFAYIDSFEIRNATSRALQNLLYSVNDDILKTSLNVDELMRALVKMLKCEDKVRIHVLNSLLNLMTSNDEFKLTVVTYDDGILLEKMTKIMASAHHYSELERHQAAKILKRLTNETTAEYMGHQAHLLSTVANVASKDRSRDIRSLASQTLHLLVEHIRQPMTCYHDLLDAIMSLAVDVQRDDQQSSGDLEKVSLMLKNQSTKVENLKSLSQHPGLIKLLVRIALPKNHESSIDAKENAIQTLANIASKLP